MTGTAVAKIDENIAHLVAPELAETLFDEAETGTRQAKIATAQWANPFLASEALPYEPGAIWLGRNPLNHDQAMGYKDDRHVFVCAGTRTGKGRTMIINNLALWPGSICAIDPKGENATIIANRRGRGSDYCDGLGQKVYVFDPFGCADVPQHMRSHFDPLSVLDARDRALPRQAGRLAEATTIVPEGESAEWAKRGRQMITTVILHVMTSPDFDGIDERGRKRRSMVTVRRLLTAGDMRAYEHFKEMGVSPLPSPMELLWDSIAHNPACDGIISDQGHSYFQSFKHHREYFESVIKSAAENTAWVDDPEMRDVLTGSPDIPQAFELETLKGDPDGQSIFLCLPVDDMPVYGRWQRVMVAAIITEMQKSQRKPACGHPLLMCLDEFPSLGPSERLEKAAAEIAGAGVKLMTVVQSLTQLQKLYKESWETFLGNSGLHIFFGMDDNTTRGYLEKALGETEVIKYLRTETRGTSTQNSEADTHGTSKSVGTTRTKGGNTTWSNTHGTNSNWGRSRGSGTNQGTSDTTGDNWSEGNSSGTTWEPGLFFRGPKINTNDGKNSSRGGNRSHTRNRGTNTNQSSNVGGGRNASSTRGGGSNWSIAKTTTDTTTQSHTRTRGTGTSESTAIAENVQKKALLPSNEADKLFALIDDPDHAAFPGLALVKISGQDPIMVRKCNYDQDPAFLRAFDPHPAHVFIPYTPPPKTLTVQEIDTSIIPHSDLSDIISLIRSEKYLKQKAESSFKVDIPISDIWAAILDLAWLPGKTSWSPLPPLFNVGTPIFGTDETEGEKTGFVWGCEHEATLSLFRGSLENGRIEGLSLNTSSDEQTEVKYFTFDVHKMIRHSPGPAGYIGKEIWTHIKKQKNQPKLDATVVHNADIIRNNMINYVVGKYLNQDFSLDDVPLRLQTLTEELSSEHGTWKP